MDVNTEESLSIGNIVATGKLDLELDLGAVVEDIRELDRIETAKHSRNQGNRLLLYFTSTDSMGILAPSGVYVFTGGNTKSDVHKSKQILIQSLADLAILPKETPPEDYIIDNFEIKNYVVTADLDQKLDLDQLAIGFGLGNTEYEPEQFPGLIYRSDLSTMVMFSTGKIIITGINSMETARSEFAKFTSRLIDIA